MTDKKESAVATLQASFIEAMQEKGIEHMFNWIDVRISELAAAQVQDTIQRIRDNFAAVPPDLLAGVVEAALIEELLSATKTANSHSTQQGANQLKVAYAAALATAVDLGLSSKSSRKGLLLESLNRSDRRKDLCARANEIQTQAERPAST